MGSIGLKEDHLRLQVEDPGEQRLLVVGQGRTALSLIAWCPCRVREVGLQAESRSIPTAGLPRKLVGGPRLFTAQIISRVEHEAHAATIPTPGALTGPGRRSE
jgi:hypothetical protein